MQSYDEPVPSSVTPDPTQLKALTHPLRLRLLSLLRADGPATATTLATRLGINSGATSYHLRQLAEHGFIAEDEERGSARDRWWRAAASWTSVEESADADEGERDAHDAFWQAALTQQVRVLQDAVAARSALPAQWRRLTSSSDVEVWATPEQAAEVARLVHELFEHLGALPQVGQERPPGTRPLGVQTHTYLVPEHDRPDETPEGDAR